ncbi:Tautomerase/MIF [Lophiostoma macrostomum CBS 122681]|uniref:L-dopachrome isomerase n=1 Tax=Lophiostoma macrostomum CBS 122681 TaxID=1314788 RepID=A0A6A6TCV0_9PLEO|nr:Tautomerase/MIF [Lophiostoma macrostomum CBS 122681]
MSRPSSSSTNDPTVFPKPAGTTLLAPEPVGDQLSPARSTFSFESSPKSVKAGSDRNVVFDEDRTMRPITHGAPGEKKGDAPGQRYGQRRRTQYFEEQFAYKDDSTSSARDRVIKDAPIIADLRTNVIIKDEYTLVTDLSHHLSQRYQRPETSIMITVNHSACLLLGGSFEPTYVLTISALPQQVQPTTNKRNASLIQAFMFESIGVHPERGVLKFVPIPEDSLATNGVTMLGEIERLERQQAEDNSSGLKRALTKGSRRSGVTKAKSSIQLSRTNSQAAGRRNITPPLPSPGPFDSGVAVNDKGQDTSAPLHPVDSAIGQKSSMKKQTSKHLRDKSGAKHSVTAFPTPPPIPEDGPMPKIGKRKSFIAIFRR